MNNTSSASCRHLAMRKPQRCPLSSEWHATLPEGTELWETNQKLEAKKKKTWKTKRQSRPWDFGPRADPVKTFQLKVNKGGTQ